MTIRKRPVSLLQLPKESGPKAARAFMQEVARCMRVDRPQLVIDCSAAGQLDHARIHLLLCCLEEAMKRSGDVKLAGIHSDQIAAHDLAGLNQLFERFESTDAALNSYHQLPSHGHVEPTLPCASTPAVESLA